MRKFFSKKEDNGYTLIETMIAISLFLVIMMFGMGSLLGSSILHKKAQNMRAIMDNLSFIMEDISRNLRTGYDYHCIDDGNLTSINPHDCASALGAGISFKSSYGNQTVYAVFPDGTLQKSTDGGAIGSFIILTPPEIKIDPSSGFIVRGALPQPGDTNQPFVVIRLYGTIISENNIVTPFSLETSVSQRLSDINI